MEILLPMLLDISSLQDKILKRYEEIDIETHEVPVILQKMYENIAALTYFAQKIEGEIKNQVYTPGISMDKAQYILSDSISGAKISECLDELCLDTNLDTIIDISVNVTVGTGDDLALVVVPIYSQ